MLCFILNILIQLKSCSCDISSISFASERMSYLVEDLSGQLGAERDDELRAGLLLIALVANDVQSGQCLYIAERHVL